jgi:cell division protein ZapA (FtsZ GTPase activity inhibitor)
MVHISLLGTSFTVQADEDPEYVTRLVKYLENKTEEVERTISVKDPLRISILTGLMIADELFKEKQKDSSPDYDSTDDAEMTKLTREMIERLDRSLEEES